MAHILKGSRAVLATPKCSRCVEGSSTTSCPYVPVNEERGLLSELRLELHV